MEFVRGHLELAGLRSDLFLGLALIVLVTGCASTVSPSTVDFSGSGCLVLVYHRIVPESPVTYFVGGADDYTIFVDDLKRQIQLLKSAGGTFIRPQELESILKKRSVPPSNCVLVTLDDGDESQYQHAFPILKQEQIPFALFVITGQVGAHSFHGMKMSTWPQIREMVDSGLATVGSHTDNMHEPGRNGLAVFADPGLTTAFAEDLQESIAAIERELGTTPQYFAYPYGFGIPQTDEIALRSGMHLIFSLREGLVRPSDPAFFVKRVMITRRNAGLIDQWREQRKSPNPAGP